jgi:hypothetical protein
LGLPNGLPETSRHLFAVATIPPIPILAGKADREFLVSVATRILGKTSVAATNADGLERRKIDSKRVDSLIPSTNWAVEVDGYVLKKVEADIETPGNFGLFVRRKLNPHTKTGVRT